MKKCEYCAKVISYHEMYCSDECQDGANKYYELREKFQKPYSIINGIFVIAVGICIFLYSFMRDVGAIGGGSALVILGIMYFLLPFAPDVMIHKYKLKKSILITKIIAAVVFAIGVTVLILYFTGVI
ncbi:DUF2116 family Zn-ribbon domain-containing protein [Ruminococcus sp.]|uniref:DUF2116 family Zn-ribbon domain-containing protein n=1 Tax=Ruminococcus sp. TaxID=41978 RepID=UPI0038906DE6